MEICPALVKRLFDEKNFRFDCRTDSDGDCIIDFPQGGKSYKMFFSGENGKYMSIYCVYESIPEDKKSRVILMCNALNRQYKWVTFYLDEDNDLMLHLDALLTPDTAADVAMEMLVRMIKIADENKSKIMKIIYA